VVEDPPAIGVAIRLACHGISFIGNGDTGQSGPDGLMQFDRP
jgi:hypothetical protein